MKKICKYDVIYSITYFALAIAFIAYDIRYHIPDNVGHAIILILITSSFIVRVLIRKYKKNKL